MASPAPSPSHYYNVYQYFEFYPSKGPIVLALVLIGLATLILLATTAFTRRWYLIIAACVGGAELIGFGCRWAMLHTPAYGTYVAMQCLLIIAPSFLALCEYLTLGKIVEYIRLENPDIQDFLKPKLIKWAYFAGEIGSLALQGAGAGLSVSVEGVNPNANTGKILLLVGLACLVIIIVTFVANAIYVCVRPEYEVKKSRSLVYLFTVLFITSALLLIRNVFRLVEFADGFYGYISTHEVYFYCLDTLMVILILYIFAIFHYGFFLNAFEKKVQVKDRRYGETEMC